MRLSLPICYMLVAELFSLKHFDSYPRCQAYADSVSNTVSGSNHQGYSIMTLQAGEFHLHSNSFIIELSDLTISVSITWWSEFIPGCNITGAKKCLATNCHKLPCLRRPGTRGLALMIDLRFSDDVKWHMLYQLPCDIFLTNKLYSAFGILLCKS